MSDLKINNITDRLGEHGPVITGVCTVTSTGAFTVPSGPTWNRGGRGRGIIAGSYPANTTLINKIEIATTGNATSFGLLGSGHSWSYPSASSTRGIFAGGYTSPTAIISGIDYVIFPPPPDENIT